MQKATSSVDIDKANLPKAVEDAQAKVGRMAVDPKVDFRQSRVHVNEVQARATLNAFVVASK